MNFDKNIEQKLLDALKEKELMQMQLEDLEADISQE